jgi:hypothetical protein
MATVGVIIASSATVEDATTAVTVEDAIATVPAIADTLAHVAMHPVAAAKAEGRLYKPIAAMAVPAVSPPQAAHAQR